MQQTSKNQRLSNEEFLSHLLYLSKQMAENRALEPLLELIIKEILTLVSAERGFVVLRGVDGKIEFKLSRERFGQEIINEIDQISRSILSYVFETQAPLLVKNATIDPRFSQSTSVMHLQLRSVMCVPLLTKQRLVGVIYVENRAESGMFTERELNLLEFFSHHAAVAIENAELNEHLEEAVQERTQQLVSAKVTAENANQAKSDFLAYVSHELRSPLTAILNYSEMLKREYYGAINERQQRAVEHVTRGATHIMRLVNDLLDLNTIEAGMLEIQFEPIDIRQIFQDIAPHIESLVHTKPIQLDISFKEPIPTIQADSKRIYQIFFNILSNAAKFTESGFIKVTGRGDETYLNITVVDSGIGIPKDQFETIFRSYRQSRNKPKEISGSGLGLPITKRLLKLHHGTITVESEVGKGTTFFIQLPILQPQHSQISSFRHV